MSPIPLGILAAQGGLVATGGNFVVDANGYRHHIFTASGTFTINQPVLLTSLVQNGGATGLNGFSTTYVTPGGVTANALVGGTGGASGQAKYISGSDFTGAMTVTVGGANGTSSLSTSWSPFATHTSNGGGGGFQAFRASSNAANGANGQLNSDIRSFWASVPNMDARTGGGGGGGSADGPNNDGKTAAAGAQGLSSRGAGGQGQNMYNPDSAYSPASAQGVGGPFAGNAGYVVISYQLV